VHPAKLPLVSTIRERCRVCYTCVRECPAKAIRIADRQAEVIPPRCIGCGNCVRVCSQRAKRVASDIAEIRAMLDRGEPLAACLAPSFPAEFTEYNPRVLVGMLRALGFSLVVEVAFGADLVAAEYRRLLEESGGRRYIATTCPAVVAYVERYHPGLIEHLAPIVSPMIATARALRKLYGKALKIVFIGPCIAKKGEATSDPVAGEVDAVMTFVELRESFARRKVDWTTVTPTDFDPPYGGCGALFPVSRGLLRAGNIDDDLIEARVVATDGRSAFVEAIREFESGDLDVELLECLCCNGCVMGPGMSGDTPLSRRQAEISRYVRNRLQQLDMAVVERQIDEFRATLNLRRTYVQSDQRIRAPSEAEIAAILSRMGKSQPEDELNCGACGYESCREHAVAIYKGLAEVEMCLPYTIDQLRTTCAELHRSNEQLATTQEALMQSEKLASMGQLAAGIAHEVNNPLGSVLMLAHLLLEEAPPDSPLREELSLIVGEADRCKKIVAGLLHFARKNKVEAREVDLRELVDRVGRANHVPEGIRLEVRHTGGDTRADLDRDQIHQVLINLLGNAFAACPTAARSPLRPAATRSVRGSPWRTPARAYRPRSGRASSSPSSPRRRRAKGRGWGWPSATAL
jgi:iron only hydrogenase large subunit-like protein